METAFLTCMLVSSFVVHSSHVSNTEWNDVVVAREGSPATLVCTDTTMRGAVSINWMVKSLHGAREWKLVLSANERKEFSGGASKASMRLTDPNFQDTGVFSLMFSPKMEDGGLYSCLIKQQERKLKERIILLAILTVSILPSPVIPQYSTLRMNASVYPSIAITKITWTSPGGMSLKSEKIANVVTATKRPRVQSSDEGIYVCTVYPWGNSSSTHFTFKVNVTIADKVVSFTDVKHDNEISTATQEQISLNLKCPDVQGDFVQLFWTPGDISKMERVYEYDRWRDSSFMNEKSRRLKLAGPPYNAEAGSFSFLLTPDVSDGGLYACEVFQNDNAFSQRTVLSVLKVKASRSSSRLELTCKYSAVSHIQRAIWTYQDKNRRLECSSVKPGVITTSVPLPVTSDTAGNYTCTINMKKGPTIWATHTVTLPPKDGEKVNVGVATPSKLPSLSALLLLVPLVAVAVGVLLWRQKQISDRGIEQSLSVPSGEVENIYENPDDVKQAPPQGSVYMDLKPRGEDDVYKELER
ncbi:g6f-like [Solea solea]|uniref:g6f-like n=1 Tax=Solea solea TaxID=90069 RepID=UPI002729568F|nr:g6f-like [Solea solea]